MPSAPALAPVFYIPHGAGPCFFMDWQPPHTWDAMAAWLRSLPASLPASPRAILLVTAHWLAEQPSVSSAAHPDMLYDYYGFPPHTYQLTYPAPGAPALAEQVAGLLRSAGFAPVLDGERGFDHGTFIPLKVAFPDADIPVLQMSLLQSLDAGAHLRLGQALAPLREQGVLIVGSGMSWHNQAAYGKASSTASAQRFDDWLVDTLAQPCAERLQLLSDWAAASAPHGHFAHPPGREEHLLPLHVAAGAAGHSPGRKVFGDNVLNVPISAFRFD